ncbi:endonuclease domain-containing protein [Mucilaginibacter sp.]|jgi:very-short-patch-repair endonuclease|uniref:endonuclease domain-containing protein n=1 Tax=Mucilaginibacter sp. TaxID=1882438 RepID=UPI002BB12BDF|nr:endonuclease domain-containing protein [Mucilaginibacter sp.]HTI60494.1 endonuclease domain-containing protein [Mucilaginibacter sp.]
MNPITDLCRRLRNNPTIAEKLLWKELRKRTAGGEKFLRQFPIFVPNVAGRKAFYIADFYCARLRLVIEVDGPIHLLRKDYDANRDLVMNELGFNILRFTNDEVENDANKVMEKIMFYLIA